MFIDLTNDKSPKEGIRNEQVRLTSALSDIIKKEIDELMERITDSKIVFKSISPAFEDEYEYTFNNLMQDIMDKYEFLVNGEKDRQEHIDLVNKLANIYRIDNKRR